MSHPLDPQWANLTQPIPSDSRLELCSIASTGLSEACRGLLHLPVAFAGFRMAIMVKKATSGFYLEVTFLCLLRNSGALLMAFITKQEVDFFPQQFGATRRVTEEATGSPDPPESHRDLPK